MENGRVLEYPRSYPRAPMGPEEGHHGGPTATAVSRIVTECVSDERRDRGSRSGRRRAVPPLPASQAGRPRRTW